jgi:undecaprenyl diphosphate synthase
MKHIGFIMDGNRTWAKENHLPQFEWHRRGYENAKSIILLCNKRSIPYVSFWALSDDNIHRRSSEEVSYLFTLLTKALPNLARQAMKENLRIQVVGDRDLLTQSCIRAIEKAEVLTQKNTGMTVILAIWYGWQEEIVRAIRKLACTWRDLTQVVTADIHAVLETGKYPPPDLIIRTGWHMRHSGFFLYQSPYAEYFFSQKNWPDFDETELDSAIADYQNRVRKFGK